jgi:hypothetical protein
MLLQHKRPVRPLGLLILAGMVSALGCGGGSGSYATVSGVVTKDSVPVDGARVTFYSTVQAEGQNTGVASVLTDSSGKYLIAAVGKDPGLPPGMYKVTVTKLDPKGVLQEGIDQGQLEAAGLSKNLLPMDYETLARTKLSVTLESGKNEKNFDLKGKPSTSVPFQTP